MRRYLKYPLHQNYALWPKNERFCPLIALWPFWAQYWAKLSVTKNQREIVPLWFHDMGVPKCFQHLMIVLNFGQKTPMYAPEQQIGHNICTWMSHTSCPYDMSSTYFMIYTLSWCSCWMRGKAKVTDLAKSWKVDRERRQKREQQCQLWNLASQSFHESSSLHYCVYLVGSR